MEGQQAPAPHGLCAEGRQRKFSHLVMLSPPPKASGVSGAGVEDWSPALAMQSFGLTFDRPEPVMSPWLGLHVMGNDEKPVPCGC